MPAMHSRDKIDIADWHAGDVSSQRGLRTVQRNWPPVVLGFIGSMALHLLLVPTVFFGTATSRIHLPDQPQGEAGQTSKSESENLVIIDLAQATKSATGVRIDLRIDRARLKLNVTKTIVIDRPRIDIHVDSSDEELMGQGAADSYEDSNRAHLAGIYSGQIRARIERIWRRPRGPVNDASDIADKRGAIDPFQCLVTIVQDSLGRVQETQLLSCGKLAHLGGALTLGIGTGLDVLDWAYGAPGDDCSSCRH
jgi:hypothetical protein